MGVGVGAEHAGQHELGGGNMAAGMNKWVQAIAPWFTLPDLGVAAGAACRAGSIERLLTLTAVPEQNLQLHMTVGVVHRRAAGGR